MWASKIFACAGRAAGVNLVVKDSVGFVERLAWAKKHGCPWTDRISTLAARGGLLHPQHVHAAIMRRIDELIPAQDDDASEDEEDRFSKALEEYVLFLLQVHFPEGTVTRAEEYYDDDDDTGDIIVWTAHDRRSVKYLYQCFHGGANGLKAGKREVRVMHGTLIDPTVAWPNSAHGVIVCATGLTEEA